MSLRNSSITALAALAAAAFLYSAPAFASAASSQIRFQNDHFVPQSLSVAAGQPLTVRVKNASTETIEFESFKLNREQVVTPGETITVHLPALSAGSYDFYDDFHQNVPQGSIVAK